MKTTSYMNNIAEMKELVSRSSLVETGTKDNSRLSTFNSRLSTLNFSLFTFNCILLCLLLSVNAMAWGGDGSEANPWQIANITDLTTLATNVSNGATYTGEWFKIMNNIDAALTVPIAAHADGQGSKNFEGNINGNNKYVTINITSASSGGFLGFIGRTRGGVTIKDLTVKGTIAPTSGTVTQAGGLIAYCDRKGEEVNIINCHSEVNINVSASYVSGIVGDICVNSSHSTVNVLNCTNTGIITSTSSGGSCVAGIIGRVSGMGVTVSGCTNFGTVTASSCYGVGGIIGELRHDYYSTSRICNITDCTNSGSVTGSYNVGGIVGSVSINVDYASEFSLISKCKNDAIVKAVGCYSTSEDGGSRLGGIVGYIDKSYCGKVIVDMCANLNTVEGSNSDAAYIGGIIGICGRPAIVRNSYNAGNVTHTKNPTSSKYVVMGGIIGKLDNYAYVYNCYNIGDVTTNNGQGYYIGGLFGNCGWKVHNCYNGGNITNCNNKGGGLVGSLGSSGVITNGYSKSGCGSSNLKAEGSGTLTGCSFFSHNGNEDNPISASVAVENGSTYPASTDLLAVLNAWVTANGNDYLTWRNATSESDNKGMPKFYSCTPVTLSSAPSLSAGNRQIIVTWGAPMNATSNTTYKLYYGVTDPNDDQSVVWNIDASSGITVPRLTNGRTYYFAVKAVDSTDGICEDNPLSPASSDTPHCP